MANYVFNPVSFFFCFGEDKKLLGCVVEVGNTFREKKVYLVRPDENGILRDRQKKFFYVSPFTELNDEFLFKISLPDEQINIGIDTVNAERTVISAGMSGRRLELNDSNIFGLTLRNPFATLRVIALIHLHAALLWLKGVPHRKKEELPEQQIAVLKRRQTALNSSGDHLW